MLNRENLVSLAFAVLIAAVLVLYPEILKDRTEGVLFVLGTYITGLLRQQPHKTGDVIPAAAG